MSAPFESLEARQFFSATVLGINWVNSAGSTLANNVAVADDSVVTAKILTVSSRGQSGNVFLFEDDGILGKSLVRTIPFTVPTASDTATVRVRLDWEPDGFGGDPEFLLARTQSFFEPIISRDVVVTRTNSFGSQVDSNDTIGEALSLGTLDDVRTTTGRISNDKDVDLFSFTVQAGQWVAFDVDSVDGFGLDSQLRIFNSAGTTLTANDDGRTNTDTAAKAAVARDSEPLNLALGRSAFTHFVFPVAGTFFVGVSGGGNFAYNPSTGGSDTSGAYSLTVTPLTRNLSTSGTTDWTGELRLANPDAGSFRDSKVAVSIHREGSAEFSASNFTWLLTHGRVDSRASWGQTVTALDSHFSDDQIFTLDWSAGARDNDGSSGLQGSAWIPLVGQWAERVLSAKGIAPSRTGLIGHSWGTYVSNEIANRGAAAGRGDVNNIVALDPANDTFFSGAIGNQYDASGVSFRAHSQRAWSFYGDGLFGSADRAATADESFKLEYVSGVGDLAKQSAPRSVFLKLLQNADSTRSIFQNFRLDRLRSGAVGPWKLDAYDSKFEGVFKVDVTDANKTFTFNSLVSVKFKNPTGGVETTLTP